MVARGAVTVIVPPATLANALHGARPVTLSGSSRRGSFAFQPRFPVTDLTLASAPPARALDALAAVIAEFNANRPLETSIAVALDTLGRLLRSREC